MFILDDKSTREYTTAAILNILDILIANSNYFLDIMDLLLHHEGTHIPGCTRISFVQ